MIARLAGLLAVRSPDGIIVDVGGVGYEVICPLTTVRALPDVGEPVVLHTVAQMNDDGIRLFGFTSDMDRVLFQKLIGVNGIGPKMAVTILSGAEASDLVAAIRSGDTVLLNRIPGVGKKTAERIVLELKGALDALTPPPPIGSGRRERRLGRTARRARRWRRCCPWATGGARWRRPWNPW